MKNICLSILFVLACTLLYGQTKTEISTADLTRPITDHLKKNMPGYSIDKAFRVDTQGLMTYEICVSKEKNLEKLTYDKEGKYIKKEVCGSECWKTAFRETTPTVKSTQKKEKSKTVK